MRQQPGRPFNIGSDGWPRIGCAARNTHSRCDGDPGLADIGVVYLYRFAEGELPARDFLASYRAHAAGVDHDLHVIFKGFPDRRALASAQTMFAGLPIRAIELDDTGFDVGSYFAAAKLVSNRRLVFFNTFSELLTDDWLKKFDTALSHPEVGLVGATGSWQSLSSYYEAVIGIARYEIMLFLNRLREFTTGARHPKEGQDIEIEDDGNRDTRGVVKRRIIARIGRGFDHLFRLDRYVLYLFQYARYPNPHVRSNAFMIERDRFLSLRRPPFNKKHALYQFESGRRSMTKQIEAQGLKPVVVGRNGKFYNTSEWKASATFWNNQQANLIAADNRTRQYANATEVGRARLRDYAWVAPSSWTFKAHRTPLEIDGR